MGRESLSAILARSWKIARDAAGSLLDASGTRHAAQLAFYVLLAFPPLLLFIVWLFSAALDTTARDHIVNAVVQALPLSDSQGRHEVHRLLTGAAHGVGGVGFFGAIVLLYSASGAVSALGYLVNEAWRSDESRPALTSRAMDAGLILLVTPVLLIAVGFNLARALPVSVQDETILAGAAEFLLTDVLPVALIFGVLMVLFRFLPASGGSWRFAWPGALAATVGLQIVQVGARVYFGDFAQSNALYGTLGALLAVMLSVYLDALAVVYGAHVSAQAAGRGRKRTRRRPPIPPGPLHRRALYWLRSLFVMRPPSQP